jgi:alkylated DNA repair dioxygenase AlkB
MGAFMNSAAAQVLIPHGDYENDFEKYLVVIISLALLCFAAWRYYRRGKF